MIIWITGLSGSGKTIIGKRVYDILKKKNNNTVFLDGDIFRDLFDNKGYTINERYEVANKISNLCNYLETENLNVICCTISLFHKIHEYNKKRFKTYYEVLIDVEMDELINRDKKGIYTAAIKGEIKNVVGIDIKPEFPKKPDLIIDNNIMNDLEKKAQMIIEMIEYGKDNKI